MNNTFEQPKTQEQEGFAPLGYEEDVLNRYNGTTKEALSGMPPQDPALTQALRAAADVLEQKGDAALPEEVLEQLNSI